MRITKPGQPLIGRVAERETLAGCLRAAQDGERQIVLVAGEPGVGKTRLAEDTIDEARALGLLCVLGRATEDEGSPPYWPFVQVFRALGGQPPTELDPAGPAGPASSGTPHGRFRLFEAVADALAQAAEATGLLIVLDDLQWADQASVRLLAHLASTVLPARLMVLATYRDTETTGQQPLRAALATLARESAVSRLHLRGLSESEVGSRLASITGWPVPDSVAAAICQRTRGNAFFVGELGRLLATGSGNQLPDGVRNAVRDRLNRLSPACRAMVSAAAVLGSDVDPVALAAATDGELDQVLRSTDEAVAAGILTGHPVPRFAHDLIREAARLEVPTGQRLELHRRMAAHLALRADRDTRTGEIAFHWLESLPAGDPEQAVRWAVLAADRSMAQLAWEEAAALYDRALTTDATHGVMSREQRSEVLLCRTRALVQAFELGTSRHTLLEAVEIARAANDPELLARAALTLEGINDFAWDAVARSWCEEALAKLPTVDSAVRVRLLAQLVVTGAWDAPELAESRSAQALAMAERIGDRHALREALRARQMALSGPDGVADRLALGTRLVALAGDADDDALWGRLWRFDALAQLGDLDGAEAETEHLAAIAARLRSPLAAWHLARCRTAVAAARGRFAEAIEFSHQIEAASERARTEGSYQPSQGVRAMLGNLTGGLEEEPTELVRLRQTGSAGGFLRSLYAMWLLGQGRREEAQRIYRSLPITTLQPFVRLTAWAGMAEFAAEFDDRDMAEDMYRNLRPYQDLFVCGGAGVVLIVGPVHYPLGLAAATVGRLDDAVRHLRAAIESSDRAGMPPMVAQATYQLARVLARRTRPGDRDEAGALAVAAAALASQLGMKPLQHKAQQLVESLSGRGSDPLTRREREVAAMVAKGLSNRQIAAAAHISERTVESHVQHALDKLGFTNRTQIATWMAAEPGKLGTTTPW